MRRDHVASPVANRPRRFGTRRATRTGVSGVNPDFSPPQLVPAPLPATVPPPHSQLRSAPTPSTGERAPAPISTSGRPRVPPDAPPRQTREALPPAAPPAPTERLAPLPNCRARCLSFRYPAAPACCPLSHPQPQHQRIGHRQHLLPPIVGLPAAGGASLPRLRGVPACVGGTQTAKIFPPCPAASALFHRVPRLSAHIGDGLGDSQGPTPRWLTFGAFGYNCCHSSRALTCAVQKAPLFPRLPVPLCGANSHNSRSVCVRRQGRLEDSPTDNVSRERTVAPDTDGVRSCAWSFLHVRRCATPLRDRFLHPPCHSAVAGAMPERPWQMDGPRGLGSSNYQPRTQDTRLLLLSSAPPVRHSPSVRRSLGEGG